MDGDKNFFIENFPRVVRIEPSSLCNLKCLHCPTGTMDIPREIMNWEVFERILCEVKKHKESVKVVVLYHGGEPFVNKNFIQMVRELKKLGIEKIKTNTNGMFLDEKMCAGLIESGIDEIEVSLDGTSPEMNNKIRRGSNYHFVVSNLKSLCKKKSEFNISLPKIIIATAQFFKEGDDPSNPKVPEVLINEFKDFEICFKPGYAMRWPIMNIDETLFKVIKVDNKHLNYCDHVINTITIRADGTVVPCCYDLTTDFPIGNVMENSLEEIWNNKKYLQIRKSIHEGGEYFSL